MSQDGSSVIRSSSYNHDAPAASTFVNTGGVLRAQLGSREDAQALQRDAAAIQAANEGQRQFAPSARMTGEIVRTTISDGVATDTTTPNVVAGTSGDSEATSGKFGVVASARSINGRPLSGNEI